MTGYIMLPGWQISHRTHRHYNSATKHWKKVTIYSVKCCFYSDTINGSVVTIIGSTKSVLAS